MSIKDIPTKWKWQELMKKFIPALFTSYGPLIIARSEDPWAYVQGLFIALGMALGVDMVTFATSKEPEIDESPSRN